MNKLRGKPVASDHRALQKSRDGLYRLLPDSQRLIPFLDAIG
jgi:hypothetical protein